MSFETSEPLKKKNIPEVFAKSRAELVEKATALSINSDLTADLITAGPTFINQAFSEYGIARQFVPTDIFFIPPRNLALIEEHFGDLYDGLGGGYLPALDWILVFLHDDLIFDIHTYFHENIHALGVAAAWASEDKVIATRVGYSFSKHNQNNHVLHRTGDFLEEATVDWLAVRATVLYLKAKGISLPDEKPERYIAEYVGGRPYSHMRDCLAYLANDDDELFNLFLQARFDLKLIVPLSQKLSRLYGRGTLAKLNKLESTQTLENDLAVMTIRPN